MDENVGYNSGNVPASAVTAHRPGLVTCAHEERIEPFAPRLVATGRHRALSTG